MLNESERMTMIKLSARFNAHIHLQIHTCAHTNIHTHIYYIDTKEEKQNKIK